MNLASLEANFKNFIVETEADVEQVVVAISKGVTVANSHIQAAIKWGISEIPSAIAGLQSASAFVASIPGASAIPDVQAALAVTAVAEQALAKLASDNVANMSTPQAALDVYTVVQQARAALPAAKAAAVAGTSPLPASAA